MRCIILAFVVVMTVGNGAEIAASDNEYWAEKDNRMVPLDQLSDESMTWYVEMIGRGNLDDYPKFHAELKQRGLDTKNDPPPTQAKDSKQALPQIRPRYKPRIGEHKSPKRKAATESAVNAYVRNLESIVRRGKMRMASHRETIALYRSFQAIEAVGSLQAIHNLAGDTELLCDKLLVIANTLRRLPDLPKDRMDFYVTWAKRLADDINKNEAVINRELNAIYFRTIPNPCR